MKVLVYAVTTSAAVTGRGVAGERLGTVRGGRLYAVVGRTARAPQPSAINLRRFDTIMRRLSAAAPALLPVRFASSFASADAVAQALTDRQAVLRRKLHDVRGRVQMTIRVLVAPGSLPANADSLDKSSGAGYLRGRAAAAAREREVPGFAAVRDAVRRFVRSEDVEKQGNVASVYHLVPRRSVEAYRRRAEAAAAAAGLRVVVSGPHPPYAFS